MKIASCIIICFVMAYGLSYASEKPALTYKKIEYVANNSATSSGFAAWLRTKPGISEVDVGNVYLVSLPPINTVYFKMKGKNYSVRVRPTIQVLTRLARESNKGWPGERNIDRHEFELIEFKHLDKILAEYNEGPAK